MMLEPTSETWRMAAEAADKLLGFYPSIMASDPKMYAAGLVQIFSKYPGHLVEEAVDATGGLPSLHDYPPTMKQAKDFLDPRFQDEFRRSQRKPRLVITERLSPLLNERPQGYLATIFVPEGHARYEKLVEWTKEARPIWWKFGVSSDGRNGLWVSLGAWEGKPESDTFEGMRRMSGMKS